MRDEVTPDSSLCMRMATVVHEVDQALQLAERLGIVVYCDGATVTREQVRFSGCFPFPSPSHTPPQTRE